MVGRRSNGNVLTNKMFVFKSVCTIALTFQQIGVTNLVLWSRGAEHTVGILSGGRASSGHNSSFLFHENDDPENTYGGQSHHDAEPYMNVSNYLGGETCSSSSSDENPRATMRRSLLRSRPVKLVVGGLVAIGGYLAFVSVSKDVAQVDVPASSSASPILGRTASNQEARRELVPVDTDGHQQMTIVPLGPLENGLQQKFLPALLAAVFAGPEIVAGGAAVVSAVAPVATAAWGIIQANAATWAGAAVSSWCITTGLDYMFDTGRRLSVEGIEDEQYLPEHMVHVFHERAKKGHSEAASATSNIMIPGGVSKWKGAIKTLKDSFGQLDEAWPYIKDIFCDVDDAKYGEHAHVFETGSKSVKQVSLVKLPKGFACKDLARMAKKAMRHLADHETHGHIKDRNDVADLVKVIQHFIANTYMMQTSLHSSQRTVVSRNDQATGDFVAKLKDPKGSNRPHRRLVAIGTGGNKENPNFYKDAQSQKRAYLSSADETFTDTRNDDDPKDNLPYDANGKIHFGDDKHGHRSHFAANSVRAHEAHERLKSRGIISLDDANDVGSAVQCYSQGKEECDVSE